jgi:hypothetical protein
MSQSCLPYREEPSCNLFPNLSSLGSKPFLRVERCSFSFKAQRYILLSCHSHEDIKATYESLSNATSGSHTYIGVATAVPDTMTATTASSKPEAPYSICCYADDFFSGWDTRYHCRCEVACFLNVARLV